jgi:1-acyl-sn-glycerol-3-phosphate acyltransferase
MDPTDIDKRDPRRVARALAAFGPAFDYYFRCDVTGLENVPVDAPAILFGNHCGSTWTIEGALLSVALLRKLGPEHPMYYLAHRAFFDLPGIGDALLSVGAVLADHDVSARILARNGKIMVFPGGDRDSHKPFRERHRVDFFGHTGFIKLSLRHRVPLVPFVHVGTHETLFVLARGARIAKAFGLKRRLGLNVFPLVLSFPFGLSLGPYFPAIPLPSKVSIRVLPPYRLWEMGFDDPDNPEHLEGALELMTGELQLALDGLAAERRWPVLG